MDSLSEDNLYHILNYYISNPKELDIATHSGIFAHTLQFKEYLQFKANTLGRVMLRWDAYDLKSAGIWTEVIQTLSIVLAEYGCFAGGFFTSLFFGLEPSKESDIDFFCFDSKKHEWLILFIATIFRKFHFDTGVYTYYLNVINIQVRKGNESRIFQLIYNSEIFERHIPYRVVSRFDNNYNRCGVYNGRAFASTDAFYARKNRRALFYTTPRLCRLKKAIQRYGLSCPDIEADLTAECKCAHNSPLEHPFSFISYMLCTPHTYSFFKSNPPFSIKSSFMMNGTCYTTVYITPRLPILRRIMINMTFKQIRPLWAGFDIRSKYIYIVDEKLKTIVNQLYKTPHIFPPIAYLSRVCGLIHHDDLQHFGWVKVLSTVTDEQRARDKITLNFECINYEWFASIVD